MTLRFHVPLIPVTVKNTTVTLARKKHLFAAGVSMNWCSPCGNQWGGFSETCNRTWAYTKGFSTILQKCLLIRVLHRWNQPDRQGKCGRVLLDQRNIKLSNLQESGPNDIMLCSHVDPSFELSQLCLNWSVWRPQNQKWSKRSRGMRP